MRVTVIIILAALLVAVSVSADDSESSCPAHIASELGHNAFGDMHMVIAPAWHDAWPNKNYEMLIEYAPKLEKAYQAVAEMQPKFKVEARQERFESRRDALGDYIKKYSEAAKNGDKEQVYALMPDLHEAFEQAAASLIPIQYPEFEGIDVTSSVILEEHVPADNQEGIVGSTETLMTQLDALTEETIPEDLTYFKKDILDRFEKMRERVAKMKDCCDNGTMDVYKEHCMAFRATVTKFRSDFL